MAFALDDGLFPLDTRWRCFFALPILRRRYRARGQLAARTAHCGSPPFPEAFAPHLRGALCLVPATDGAALALDVSITNNIGIRIDHNRILAPDRLRQLGHLLPGTVISGGGSGDDIDAEPHGSVVGPSRPAPAGSRPPARQAAAGTGIGPSTKMPAPRRATAISPASTPVGNDKRRALETAALGNEPVTSRHRTAAAVSIAGSSRMP